ncbi:MAG TPA: hypothetical protein ENJ98_05205 [Thiolapillus brandeum]|uniref:Uncharacterized protein n=1 Tax=Thiolapillus brandeum TaxID=1076588 RepID=A0A7C5IZ02_9GAMM|nr:hypothetical protein [Thiolapillus brandeum]
MKGLQLFSDRYLAQVSGADTEAILRFLEQFRLLQEAAGKPENRPREEERNLLDQNDEKTR